MTYVRLVVNGRTVVHRDLSPAQLDAVTAAVHEHREYFASQNVLLILREQGSNVIRIARNATEAPA